MRGIPREFSSLNSSGAAFKNGRNRAIRIPREFELPGEEALLSRDEGGRLIIEPVRHVDLCALLSSWDPLGQEDGLPEIDDLPAEPVNL
jgi:antitoxin VapB